MIVVKELNHTHPKVGGVIVIYHPDESLLPAVIEATLSQVDFLYLVNNGDHPIQINTKKFRDQALIKKIETIENGQNLGIATALNIGLKALIDKGCSYFLMLDQDSLIPEGMVLKLLKSLDVLNRQGLHVAAIGPTYFHSHLHKYAPFIQFGKLSLKKIQVENDQQLVETHFLITSGTLVTLDALQNVGLMEDALFIDFVDTEWCLRAVDKQYKLYGDSGARMTHSLGDEPVTLLGRKFSMHSPLRHYYLVRNAVYLVKKAYIPLNSRFVIFVMTLKYFIFYSLIPSNRTEHFRKMLRGLKDGLNNNLGRYK